MTSLLTVEDEMERNLIVSLAIVLNPWKIMRRSNLVCDWCHEEMDAEFEDPLLMGWLSVEIFDIMKDDIVTQDFCSKDCLRSFFNDD